MSIMNCFSAGGGIKLNIKAYAAVGNLPASDKEGAIAVITIAAINNVFASADEPASPASGDVWVWLGGESLAPVVFDKSITLHPRAVYQHDGADWDVLESYVHTEGAWAEVTLYLYDSGAFILSDTFVKTAGSLSVTLQASQIDMYVQGTYGSADSLAGYFSDAVDLTLVDAVKMVVTCTNSNLSNVAARVATDAIGSNVVASAVMNTPGTQQTLTIDVTALSGRHYVGAYIQTKTAPSGVRYEFPAYIHKTYLER